MDRIPRHRRKATALTKGYIMNLRLERGLKASTWAGSHSMDTGSRYGQKSTTLTEDYIMNMRLEHGQKVITKNVTTLKYGHSTDRRLHYEHERRTSTGSHDMGGRPHRGNPQHGQKDTRWIEGNDIKGML